MWRRIQICFFFIVGILSNINSQELVTLSGYLKDSKNGETLIGASAYITELSQGVNSNEYGFYSLTVPPGKYNVQYSFLGYHDQTIEVNLTENKTFNVDFVEESIVLAEAVVTAEAPNSNVSKVEMSTNRMDIGTIKKMPSLLGEVEIIRSIQALPGVTSVGEGASGFNVRGGSIDQNLVLLDEAPVYNSSHLFGFFSVFNPDAVKDVKLYKGGMPSRYGGRLSSVLDVRMKEGNSKNIAFQGGIGLIFSRLSVEGPIVKDKGSFIVAARRSYIDILAQPFLNEKTKGSILNFYDLTLKANYELGKKDRVFVSAYLGRDNFGFGQQAGFNWGNSTTTLRWNHVFNQKLFSNLTLFTSDYDYVIKFGSQSSNKFDWNANIKNYSIKPEFTYFLTPNNIIRFGGQSIYYKISPGNAIGVSEGQVSDYSIPQKFAFENALYVENEINIGDALSVNYGLRASLFDYIGEGNAYLYQTTAVGQQKKLIGIQSYKKWETIKNYLNLEPRLAIKYEVSPDQSIKASYNRMVQNLHLISNTTASTPVDIWLPSTNNIKPEIADQVAIGYFKNLNDNEYEISLETYYKKFKNTIDYIDGADLILNEYIEGDLLEGKGRAYGLEFMVEKSKGRFNGWLSYTLARTERLVEGINNNEWYPSRFDQTHKFNLAAFYEINSRWSVSANFAFLTGTPNSFPTSKYTIQGYTVPDNGNNSRNNIRIPVYHRLDISATLQGKKNPTRRWQNEWVFSIYNVYSKKNPFSIYTQQNNQGQTEAIKLSVIGNFIPSISYNFKY